MSASLTLLVPFVLSHSLTRKQHIVYFFLIGSFRLCLVIRRLSQPSYNMIKVSFELLHQSLCKQAFLAALLRFGVVVLSPCSCVSTTLLRIHTQLNNAASTVSSSVALICFLFYRAITKLSLLSVSARTLHVLIKSDGYN